MKLSTAVVHGINYTVNKDGHFLNFPPDIEVPSYLNQPSLSKPKPPASCQAPGMQLSFIFNNLGCNNPRKYTSKTNISLCSLNCYKKVEAMKQETAIH